MKSKDPNSLSGVSDVLELSALSNAADNEMQKEIQEILLRKLRLEIAEKEQSLAILGEKKAEEDRIKAHMLARKQQLRAAVEEAKARRAAETAGCGHRKPNGRWSLGGQTTHGGSYIIVCTQCAKMFTEDTLPPGAVINKETMGGPV